MQLTRVALFLLNSRSMTPEIILRCPCAGFGVALSACSGSSIAPTQHEARPSNSIGPAPCTQSVQVRPLASVRTPSSACPGSTDPATTVFIGYLSNQVGYPPDAFALGGCSATKTCFFAYSKEMACQGTPSSCAGTPCNGSPETIGDIVLGTTASANGVAITEINRSTASGFATAEVRRSAETSSGGYT